MGEDETELHSPARLERLLRAAVTELHLEREIDPTADDPAAAAISREAGAVRLQPFPTRESNVLPVLEDHGVVRNFVLDQGWCARSTAIRSSYRHTLIFLSIDGGTIGNAGTRWYLRSVDRSRIAGMQ